MKVGDERYTCVAPIIFLSKMIFFHDVSLKKCLYSVWKQNKSGLLTENSHVLNLQDSKVNSFF